MSKEKRERRLELKKKEKENLVRKFFPYCLSSPRGTQRLIANKPTDDASAEYRRVGKGMAPSFENHSAKN